MNVRTRLVLIVVAVVVATAILRIAGVAGWVTSAVQRLFMPAAETAAAVGSAARGPLERSKDVATLEARVQELEARLASVTVDYVRLRAAEEENRSLRAMAGFLSETGYDHVPARVIARSTDPREATVLIDRGARDGLQTGMAVIVDDGVFIGKVVSLGERVATVMLISDERSRVAASRAGIHRLIGVVEGRGNQVARLTLVPQVEEMKRDDIIMTAGTEEKIPGNLPIGLVDDVEGAPTDPFKSAILEPLQRLDRVDVVMVLRSSALRPPTSTHD